MTTFRSSSAGVAVSASGAPQKVSARENDLVLREIRGRLVQFREAARERGGRSHYETYTDRRE